VTVPADVVELRGEPPGIGFKDRDPPLNRDCSVSKYLDV